MVAIRAGERWRERLPELIAEADVFQLFWSSNSMRSPYCRAASPAAARRRTLALAALVAAVVLVAVVIWVLAS